MKRNMGTVDRLLRALVIAPVLIVLSVVVFGVGTVPGIVALVVAAIMVVTPAVGFCPTYTLFGIDTHGGISTHGQFRVGGESRVAAQH